MKTVLCLCAVLLLACCTGCEPDASSQSPTVRIEVTHIEWSVSETGFVSYKLNLRLHGGKMRGVIDEKTVTAPGYPVITAVEYFGVRDMGWDYANDTLTGFAGTVVEGCVYAADATGEDRNEYGFAMLPANMDGTFTTTPDIANYVNAEYFAAHTLAGSVTKHDRTAVIHYRIECDSAGLTFTVGGVSTFHAAP